MGAFPPCVWGGRREGSPNGHLTENMVLPLVMKTSWPGTQLDLLARLSCRALPHPYGCRDPSLHSPSCVPSAAQRTAERLPQLLVLKCRPSDGADACTATSGAALFVVTGCQVPLWK